MISQNLQQISNRVPFFIFPQLASVATKNREDVSRVSGFANLIHQTHKKMVTISAVRPPARFGSLSLKGNDVVKFKEKTQLGESWINGGFFVINPKFLEFIEGDNTVLESKPLEKVTDLKEIRAFKHEGFWQCMDHKLDKDLLDGMVKDNKAPWIKKK